MRGCLVIVVLLLAETTQATTLTVCPSGCDYTSIQSVIDAACTGDTVEVQSGIYHENVTKSLILFGKDTGKGVVLESLGRKTEAEVAFAKARELGSQQKETILLN